MEKLGNALSNVLHYLLLVFIGLRACGVTDWEWYQVFIPLFVRAGIALVSVIILGVVKYSETVRSSK